MKIDAYKAERAINEYENAVCDAFCACVCNKYSEDYQTRYITNGCVKNACSKVCKFADAIKQAGAKARQAIYNNA